MVRSSQSNLNDLNIPESIWEDFDCVGIMDLIEGFEPSGSDSLYSRIENDDLRIDLICHIIENSKNTNDITLDLLSRRYSGILAKFKNSPDTQLRIFKSFLKNPNNPNNKISIEDLKNLDGSFGQYLKLFLEQKNNPRNQISLGDLIGENGLLNQIPDQDSRVQVLKSFLLNPDNPNNHITIQELIQIKDSQLIEDEFLFSALLEPFFQNHNNPNNRIAIKELMIKKDGLLTHFPDLDHREFTKILSLFLENSENQNNKITLGGLNLIIKTSFEKEYDRASVVSDEMSIKSDEALILSSFIRNKNNKVGIDQLIGEGGFLSELPKEKEEYEDLELISSSNQNDELKMSLSLILAFLKNPYNQIITKKLEEIELRKDPGSIRFSDHGDKLAIVLSFLKNPHSQITIEKLEEILTYFGENEYYKQKIVSSFLTENNSQNPLFFDDLVNVLDLFSAESNRAEIIKSFFSNPKNYSDIKDLKYAIGMISDQNLKLKLQIVESFLKNNNQIKFSDLKEILISFEGDNNKFKIISAFFENIIKSGKRIDNSQKNEILNFVSQFIGDDEQKSKIICLLIKNLKDPISLNEIAKILSLFSDGEAENNYSKLRILSSFLGMNNPHNQIGIDDFMRSSAFFQLSRNDQLKITLHFLARSNNPNNQITLDQLIANNGLLSKFKREEDRFLIMAMFVKHNKSTLEGGELILKILPNFKSEDHKYHIARLFIDNPNNKVSSLDLTQIRTLLLSSDNIQNRFVVISSFLFNPKTKIGIRELSAILRIFRKQQPYKLEITEYFLGNPNTKVRAKEFLLSEKGILSRFRLEQYKRGIVFAFLKNPNNEISIEDLIGNQGVLSKFSNQDDKFKIVKSFIENRRNEIDLDGFCRIMEGLRFFEHDLTDAKIYSLYEILARKDQKNIISEINQISEKLGLQENQKIDILERSLGKFRAILEKNWDQDFLKELKDFTDRIGDDNYRINFRNFLIQTFRSIDNKDALILSAGNIDSRYDSIKTILESQTSLKDSLTEDGIKILKEIFGNDIFNLEIDHRFVNLSDIFAYFDAKNQNEFVKIIKPELAQEIQETCYKSCKNKSILSSDDMSKIRLLFPDQDIDKNFIFVGDLCSVVENKARDVINFNSQDQNININFDGCDEDYYQNENNYENLNIFLNLIASANIKNDEEELKCEQAFRELFGIEAPEEEYVPFYKQFFGRLFKINFDDVVDADEKLKEFFLENKDDFLYAISSPDIGVKGLIPVMHSLGDGCAFNISSNFAMKLYSTIFDKVSDQIMYMVSRDKVVTRILNSGGDVVGTQKNPFTNPRVKNCYISYPSDLLEDIVSYISAMKLTDDSLLKKLSDELGIKTDESGLREVLFNAAKVEAGSEDNLLNTDILNKTNDQAIYVLAYMTLEKFLGPKGEQILKDADFSECVVDMSFYQKENGSYFDEKSNIKDLVGFVKNNFVPTKPRNSVQKTTGKQLIPEQEKSLNL